MDLVEVGRDYVDWECSTNGKKSNAYRLLVEKPEGRRLLARPRGRWADNIKIGLGLPSGLFPTNNLYAFLFSPFVLHA
jgi:hypothetical protein